MEQQFYIIENDQRLGPYSIEELKQRMITKTTLVWKNGLENWVFAESVEELISIFSTLPPPIPIENFSKTIINSDEPLKFEDSIKKNEIEKRDARKKKSKRITANEIKNILKFNKIALIVAASVFIISFGLFSGYKFLYYFFEAGGGIGKSIENNLELKFISSCESYEDFLIKRESNNGLPESFSKWSKLFGLNYRISEGEFNNRLYNLRETDLFINEFVLSFSREENIAVNEFMKVNITSNYFQTQNGEIIYNNNQRGYYILKATDLERLLINKSIIQKTTVDFIVEVYYGKYIISKLNNALEKSFTLGLIFYCIIFPLSYLILLFSNLYKRSRNWISKNATN